ncbi:MAG: hypothetical protein CMQ12_00210 [Gammaproteobacteria bacterium]|nr:hypothetical protein [Gammaproteobacteria bacterium]
MNKFTIASCISISIFIFSPSVFGYSLGKTMYDVDWQAVILDILTARQEHAPSPEQADETEVQPVEIAVESGATDGDEPPVSTDESIVVFGEITSINPFTVEQVEFDLSGAVIETDDDGPAAILLSDLQVGDIVRIEGTRSNETSRYVADRIFVDAEVEGTITQIDAANASFTVLGMTVTTTSSTNFSGAGLPGGLGDLAAGQFVEVTGYMTSGGGLRATRVHLEKAGSDFSVKGIVTAVSAENRTLTLGSLTIDYGNAHLDDFGARGILVGDLIEVSSTTPPPSKLAWQVDEVELESDTDEEFESAKLRGLITALPALNLFEVNLKPVSYSDETVFECGSEMDLVLDAEVVVEGRYTGGVFVAAEIEFDSNKSCEDEHDDDGKDGRDHDDDGDEIENDHHDDNNDHDDDHDNDHNDDHDDDHNDDHDDDDDDD